MNKNPADASQPYRSLIAGYTDAIRASDFKANIAILFVAFMMGPVLGNYTRFPSYLPIPFVMLPFLIVYLCLFAVLIPRYPRRGSKNFLVSRTATSRRFSQRRRDGRRARAVEAALRGPVRIAVVEDSVHQNQFYCFHGEYHSDHILACLHLVYLMQGR